MTLQTTHGFSGEAIPTLSDAAFARIAERIRAESGIVLAAHKKQMAQARISRRLSALNLPTFEAYLDHLDQCRDATEHRAFVDALTTNLTSFFREPHHFEHFENVVMTRLANRNAPKIRLWSAACSTGEEAYSIALIARKMIPPDTTTDMRILATDIDTQVLKKAALGQYLPERVEQMGAEFAELMTGMCDETGVSLSQEIKDLIAFRRLNLFDQWPFKGSFDAIFCRNVIIYFEVNERRRLVDRLVDRIVPGGYLYLGHSEALIEHHPNLESEGHTIYRKIE